MIQIVPYFTPQVTGVGDYALMLAREFRRAHGLETVLALENGEASHHGTELM